VIYVKKLMLIVAMVLMVAVAAVPALANVEFDQDAESGDVVQVYNADVSGSYNVVASDVDFDANTGNVQEAVFVIQYNND
jgi:hypothetical protein